jgi:hypothetical protein
MTSQEVHNFSYYGMLYKMEDTSLNEHSSALEEMTIFGHVLHSEFYLYLIFKHTITLTHYHLENGRTIKNHYYFI